MYELKKIGKVFTSKYDGTRPSSYEKRSYRATVSQRLRNTVIMDHKEIGWEYMDWIDSAQNWSKWWFVVNAVIEHAGPIKYRKFLD